MNPQDSNAATPNAVAPPLISGEQLDALRKTDLQNLIAKLKSGKPLTGGEWKRILDYNRTTSGDKIALPQYAPSQTAAAAALGIHRNLLAGWERLPDCPHPAADGRRDIYALEQFALSRGWLQKSGNGTSIVPNAVRSKKRRKKSNEKAGASGALTRLEQAELTTYAELQDAVANGDPIASQRARDAWLKTSESLRRYDLLVEQARRSTGELLPKSELLRIVERFAYATRVGFTVVRNATAPQLAAATSSHECDAILERALNELWVSAVRKLLGNPVHDWAKDAIEAEIRNAFRLADENAVQPQTP